jgi:hypothetical protein
MPNQKPSISSEGEKRGEVRLVACGRTPDGRVLPCDDDSWDAAITEEEAGKLIVVLETLGHEFPVAIAAKLRDAFPRDTDA